MKQPFSQPSLIISCFFRSFLFSGTRRSRTIPGMQWSVDKARHIRSGRSRPGDAKRSACTAPRSRRRSTSSQSQVDLEKQDCGRNGNCSLQNPVNESHPKSPFIKMARRAAQLHRPVRRQIQHQGSVRHPGLQTSRSQDAENPCFSTLRPVCRRFPFRCRG